MNWKTITLFISSTFNDMHDERDYIKRHVVNRLNETLEPYHISVQVTDLRWGIDTHNLIEEEQELKVLHICTDAIENSRPYFIGILGHRYGWMPDSNRMAAIREQYSIPGEEPCSVTEMEIMLGAISKKDYLSHSYFFFRDSSSYSTMDDVTRLLYMDGEDGSELGIQKRDKLISLKNKIQNTLSGIDKTRVHEYHARWNGEHFVDLDSFGNLMYEALIDDILDKDGITEDDHGEFSIASFIHAKSYLFTGHSSLVERLVSWAKGYVPVSRGSYCSPQNGIILTGPSGAGKSALWAHLVGLLEKDKNYKVYTAVAGVSDQMTYFSQIRDQIETLPVGTIILIDGIDRIPDCRGLADFLSSNKMFTHPYICTCTDDYFDVFDDEFSFYKSLGDKGSFRRVSLPPIGYQDAEKLISGILFSNNKELSRNIKDALLKSVMTDEGAMDIHAPFRLRIALNILLEMGAEDFRKIRSIAAGNDAGKIESYLENRVDSFPKSLVGIIQYFLNLTIDLFEPKLAESVLVNLALSRYGLTSEDLETLSGDCWDSLEFGNLCFWLRSFVQKNSYTGKYYLSHTLIKKSICQIFEKDLPQYQEVFLSVIKDRFHDGRIGADEYVYGLIRCHDIHRFFDYLDEHGATTHALGSYMLDDEQDGFRFIRDYFKEYRDYVYNDNVLYAMSAGYTPETRRCKWLLENAKAIQQGFFTKDELLSGDYNTLFSYFDVVYSRMEHFPELFNKAHQFFLENREKYGAALAQPRLADSYFSCWGRHFFSLHRRYRSIYHEEPDHDRRVQREKEMERLIVRDLHVLLEECQWFQSNAKPIASIHLFEVLWGNDLMHFTSNMNWDTDINERIAAYQNIQNLLWSMNSLIKDSNDDWLIDAFNSAAKGIVEKYRKLFKIFSNTPFQPTELSNYVDSLY